MCFPDSDDTERSGIQHWHLLATVLREAQRLPSTGGRGRGGGKQKYSDFLSFLSSGKLSPISEAFHRLAREPAAHTWQPSAPPRLVHIANLSLLEALPAEILALILNNGVLSMPDTLSLGSCSLTMWSHVWKHIQEDCRRATAPWAGTPIVATTNWLGELPDTLKDIFPDIDEGIRQPGIDSIDLGPGPARHWLAKVVASSREVTTKDRGTEWLEAGEAVSADLRSSLEEAVKAHRLMFGEKWVLRNLTASEFVRLEVRGIPEPAVMVAGSDLVSLDQLLLLNICWGVDSAELIRKSRLGYLRGQWAGHAFDVVRSNEFEGWQDVTHERLHHVLTALQGSRDKVQ